MFKRRNSYEAWNPIPAATLPQAPAELANTAPQPPRPAPEIGGFLRAVATASAAAAAGTLKLPDPAAMASLSAMAVQQPPLGAISMPVRLSSSPSQRFEAS